MSTDRVDIADLVAKLDADIAWIDARRESGHGMWPTDIKFGYDDAVELRRIVVAAKEYADAEDELTASFEITDSLEFANRSRVAQQRVTNALAKVYSAVRGEA